jgi:hypothetical protein
MKEELNKEKRINFMNISISPPKNLNWKCGEQSGERWK